MAVNHRSLILFAHIRYIEREENLQTAGKAQHGMRM